MADMDNQINQTVERIGQLPDGVGIRVKGNSTFSSQSLAMHTPTNDLLISSGELKALAAAYTKAVAVLKMANIEIVPDGHQFSPKAVKAYCGEHTQKRIEKLEVENEKLRACAEHYANIYHWGDESGHNDRFSVSPDENGYDLAQQTLDELGKE